MVAVCSQTIDLTPFFPITQETLPWQPIAKLANEPSLGGHFETDPYVASAISFLSVLY